MIDNANEAVPYNALTDAWLPLVQQDGTTVWGSPIEVLCGEKDGVDLDYPRDDFRVYARLLLSALVQALFAAESTAELSERLASPLERADVERRVQPVLQDFDLFGPTPFLQVVPPSTPPDKAGAAPFVFPAEDLFRSGTAVEKLALPVALVMLFAEHTYAGMAGRGYSLGINGQPGVMTLVDPGSVRLGAWANTLTVQRVRAKYAEEDTKPWSSEKRAATPRAAIGLVTGLFFQPRSIWLIPAGEGECSFSGLRGATVSRSRFLSKSEFSKKPSGGEDLWQHPCAPLAVNSQRIAPIRLNAERPAWTGLAQMLRPVSHAKSKKQHPSEGPALVLQQWKALRARVPRTKLLLLDFDRDKANIKRRFFEAFPLTDHLLHDADAVEQLRAVVEDAQQVLRALLETLTAAHDGRRQGGFALADAQSAFWSASERAFLDWLAVLTATDTWSDEQDERLSRYTRRCARAVRSEAITIFDQHVSMSEFDLRKQEDVAKARRRLRARLFPHPTEPATTPSEKAEVRT